ncbi:hypothetical protein GOPIP_031_04270 [Gordonia polyisoprenivorans NBRC 16320 = JCM 10675]|nr:hypothetical protein GOPIP_031_04270 [Gordonia polyisoprenivorans NBRC 16320 = JCM 10675]
MCAALWGDEVAVVPCPECPVGDEDSDDEQPATINAAAASAVAAEAALRMVRRDI